MGWETGMEMRALTAYSIRGGELRELVRTGYAKYAVADLDQDSAAELVVFRTDEQGGGIADLYVWKAGLEKASTVQLSITIAELQAGSVVTGMLRDGAAALFVCGVRDDVLAADMLHMTGGLLENAVSSPITGMTTEMFRYRGLTAEDIDGDGITEIPAVVMLNAAENSEYYRVDWYSYDSNGLRQAEVSTYHNTADGWYLELPQVWLGKFMVSRERTDTGESTLTFFRKEESTVPFLRICAISGSGREQKAARGNRLILSRQTDVIYTVELLPANNGWDGSVTEDQLRGSFRLIERKWAVGDN